MTIFTIILVLTLGITYFAMKSGTFHNLFRGDASLNSSNSVEPLNFNSDLSSASPLTLRNLTCPVPEPCPKSDPCPIVEPVTIEKIVEKIVLKEAEPVPCPPPVECPPKPKPASEEDLLLPPSPPAIRLGTTANQTEKGQHVPCAWIIERYGSDELMAEIRANITEIYVTTGALDASVASSLSTAAPPSSAGSSSDWLISEHIMTRCLLKALSIPCDSSSLRSQCLDPSHTRRVSSIDSRLSDCPGWEMLSQARLTSATVHALHAWYQTLPTTRWKEWYGQYDFNAVTGTIAALRCKATSRYGYPFANQLKKYENGFPTTLFVQPQLEQLPTEYSQFVEEKCTVEPPSPSSSASTAVAESLPSWLQPLFPILPTVCNINSFTRPSQARQCLRNKRILALGDSTVQELLLQLIDFLETPDGEREDDLTQFRSPNERHRDWQYQPKPDGRSEWNDKPVYYYLHAWTDPLSCPNANTNSGHWNPASLSRLFSTAFMPTPYLAAWNITITMRWNPCIISCQSMQGPIATNTLEMWQATYRYLRDTCLPTNAVEFVNSFRRRPDGTYLDQHDYVKLMNEVFPSTFDTNHTAQYNTSFKLRPKYGCSHPGYLDDSVTASFGLNQWNAHLATVPQFDHLIFHMGAHYTHQWRRMHEHPHYQWTPVQFQHTFEHALTMAQQFGRAVIVKEVAWRGQKEKDAVDEVNKLTLESTIQAQMVLYQSHAEEVRRLNEEVKLRASLGLPPPPSLSLPQPRRRLDYMPVHALTIGMDKQDGMHCSQKNLHGGYGEDGIRTPYCYQLVQTWLQMMCQMN